MFFFAGELEGAAPDDGTAADTGEDEGAEDAGIVVEESALPVDEDDDAPPSALSGILRRNKWAALPVL